MSVTKIRSGFQQKRLQWFVWILISCLLNGLLKMWRASFFFNTGNWVPLDEYYYGKMEGDPTYSEEKGEHRFKVGHKYVSSEQVFLTQIF